MRFTPKSEKEIQEMNLIPNGIYPFEVVSATEKKSKSGNDMIELVLKVWDHNGRERTVYHRFMDIEAFQYKVRHFCEVTGMLDKYESGHLTDRDCWGKFGYVKIGIQKDKKGQYSDKNVVQDYVPKSNDTALAIEDKKDSKEFDDDIPF